MSALKAVEEPRHPIDIHRIALAVLLTVASFAVVYLITANVILRTRVLRDAVSEGIDVELDYASAYSVWPGLVRVRGLSLSVQDYNIQFSVRADSGVISVSLHDLAFRRFHATRVVLDGLSFRFRHKVQPSEADSPSVAALPPIAGFDDPPVYVGEKSPPISDAEYDLWQIAIDEVHADLSELWLMQYRYVGAGRIVRGGFRIQPARGFAVYPARVELARGSVSVGDDTAVQRLVLAIDGHVDYTDVRRVDGAALADTMSGQLRLDAHGLSLGALDIDAGARRPRRVEGVADLTLKAAMSAGRLEPESSAELTAHEVALVSSFGKLSGSVSSSLKSQPGGQVVWTTSSPKLTLANGTRAPGPVIGAPRLTMMIESESMGKLPELRELRAEVPELDVPSLAWAKRWLPAADGRIEVGGRLTGRANVSWAAARGVAGRVHLQVADAELSTEKIRASLAGQIDAKLEPGGLGSSSKGRLDIDLDGVEVERVRERTKPFRAAIRLPDLRVALEPQPTFSASVEVSAQPVDSLLSLALGAPMLEDLAADVFALRDLEAQARLNVSEHAVRFELARAASGSLTGTGYWQRPATGGSRGAFLISSRVANVGISLVGSDTKTAWFVPDDWLASGSPPRERKKIDPLPGNRLPGRGGPAQPSDRASKRPAGGASGASGARRR